MGEFDASAIRDQLQGGSAFSGAVPVGGWDPGSRQPSSKKQKSADISTLAAAPALTTFKKDDGVWFFGAEVPVSVKYAVRDFLRRDATGLLRRVDFFRFEFSVDLDDARQYGIKRGDTLTMSQLPAGQRRVHSVRLQKYAEIQDDFIFEDVVKCDGTAGNQAPETVSDGEAIALLHRLDTNLFASRRVLSASLSSLEAGAFRSYEDADADAGLFQTDGSRDRRSSARQRDDGTFALGIVSDASSFRRDMYLELNTFFNLISEAGYRVPIPDSTQSKPLPLEIAMRAVTHFDLAIAQAMGGAGFNNGRRFDRPVAHYVKDLTHGHLLSAINRLEGRLPPRTFGVDFEYWTSPEDDDDDQQPEGDA